MPPFSPLWYCHTHCFFSIFIIFHCFFRYYCWYISLLHAASRWYFLHWYAIDTSAVSAFAIRHWPAAISHLPLSPLSSAAIFRRRWVPLLQPSASSAGFSPLRFASWPELRRCRCFQPSAAEFAAFASFRRHAMFRQIAASHFAEIRCCRRWCWPVFEDGFRHLPLIEPLLRFRRLRHFSSHFFHDLQPYAMPAFRLKADMPDQFHFRRDTAAAQHGHCRLRYAFQPPLSGFRRHFHFRHYRLRAFIFAGILH